MGPADAHGAGYDVPAVLPAASLRSTSLPMAFLYDYVRQSHEYTVYGNVSAKDVIKKRKMAGKSKKRV